MKKIFTLLLVGICAAGFSQTHPLIDSLIKEVNKDTVVQHVRNLSGEDECTVGGKKVLIKNRKSANKGLAADYFKEALERFGITVTDDNYGGGRNVMGTQIGTTYPDKFVIVGSHYDAVADYCADDNVSSVSAIIEAARHLSKFKFKHTIIYTIWDEEETGMNGSKSHAGNVNADDVKAVLNIEMLGYDSNNDWLFEIHTKDVGNSVELANIVVNVNDTYRLKLKSKIENPGTDRSDHASFWNKSIGAIAYSEAFFNKDGNPDYHTARDRISNFNIPYYHELCKLTAGNIATIAEPDDIINGTKDINLNSSAFILSSYPNPSNDMAKISYTLPYDSNISIKVYDEAGKEIYGIDNQFGAAGKHNMDLNTANFSTGIYQLVLKTDRELKTRKLVVLK